MVQVPSLIYQSLIANPRQCGAVPALLLRALGYICCVTVCKALVSVSQSSAALLWRGELTRFMHQRYLHRGAHYHLALLQPSVDNPDQRIARELDLWSTNLAELVVAVSTSLFNILWYTLQTWLITGWHGPALIFGFFVASALITRLVASPVAALTARCQAAEGDFRAMHATLLSSSEATALCSNGEAEGVALGESFGALVMLRWQLVLRRGLLSLTTFFFEYLGSIVRQHTPSRAPSKRSARTRACTPTHTLRTHTVMLQRPPAAPLTNGGYIWSQVNYVAVGIALCGGMYDGREAGELSLIVSRGSTFAITMCARGGRLNPLHTSFLATLGHGAFERPLAILGLGLPPPCA